jgi:hypothetical protein
VYNVLGRRATRHRRGSVLALLSQVLVSEVILLVKMPGWEAWQAIVDLVKNLSEVMLSTLPGFWRIAKAYMDGKYRKVA